MCGKSRTVKMKAYHTYYPVLDLVKWIHQSSKEASVMAIPGVTVV